VPFGDLTVDRANLVREHHEAVADADRIELDVLHDRARAAVRD
jgi:hypothetical protein